MLTISCSSHPGNNNRNEVSAMITVHVTMFVNAMWLSVDKTLLAVYLAKRSSHAFMQQSYKVYHWFIQMHLIFVLKCVSH